MVMAIEVMWEAMNMRKGGVVGMVIEMHHQFNKRTTVQGDGSMVLLCLPIRHRRDSMETDVFEMQICRWGKLSEHVSACFRYYR